MGLSLFLNMLTPIKKQGDEHIYILLKIGIIDWMSGCYMGVYRFVWMLIGSEITYGDALSILYEVRVIGNHADGDMVLLKKSCHEITLLSYPSTRGCPARHLMMPCQFRSKKRFMQYKVRTKICKSTGILR